MSRPRRRGRTTGGTRSGPAPRAWGPPPTTTGATRTTKCRRAGTGASPCHHHVDGCIALPRRRRPVRGDDFGPTADVDYADSSSEDDEKLRDAAAAASESRAAAVPGVEDDGAWIALQAAIGVPRLFAAASRGLAFWQMDGSRRKARRSR